MPKKINQDVSIQFSMDLYHSFWGLGERGLMTPTYLSTLIMLVVLPATLSVEKKNSLAPADTSLFESPVNNGHDDDFILYATSASTDAILQEGHPLGRDHSTP